MPDIWDGAVDPGHEPHKIIIRRGALVDESRSGRTIPYKFYCPSAPDMTGLPVIFWSHGLGGSCEGAGFLARFIAAQGYIVFHLQHPGTDSSLWEGKPGHPWDVIRAAKIPRAATLDRFFDVPSVLDHWDELTERHPELGAQADFDNIGMSGHSFGALSTQVMAGQLFPDEQDALQSYAEKRFRAGILYSFVPMGHLTDAAPETLFGPMAHMPLLFMTGTKDDSPVEGFDYTYRLPVYEHCGAREKALLVLEGGDHMVFAGSRGQLGDQPLRKRHEDIIKITALAFWDIHLKDSESARRWVSGGAMAEWLGSDANYTGSLRAAV